LASSFELIDLIIQKRIKLVNTDAFLSSGHLLDHGSHQWTDNEMHTSFKLFNRWDDHSLERSQKKILYERFPVFSLFFREGLLLFCFFS